MKSMFRQAMAMRKCRMDEEKRQMGQIRKHARLYAPVIRMLEGLKEFKQMQPGISVDLEYDSWKSIFRIEISVSTPYFIPEEKEERETQWREMAGSLVRAITRDLGFPGTKKKDYEYSQSLSVHYPLPGNAEIVITGYKPDTCRIEYEEMKEPVRDLQYDEEGKPYQVIKRAKLICQ